MKKEAMFLSFSVVFILTGCSSPTKPSTDIATLGAWYLYALNYSSGDSTLFKTEFPDKNYEAFLLMEAIPMQVDTLADSIVHISFIWSNNGQFIRSNFLTYHSVDFDLQNRLKTVHFDDGGELHINNRKGNFDKKLRNLIKSNKKIKLSEQLQKGYDLSQKGE